MWELMPLYALSWHVLIPMKLACIPTASAFNRSMYANSPGSRACCDAELVVSFLAVKYKLGMITRRCLNGTAPQYLAAHCVPVSATASRQHLRSAASHQLVVPSYRLSSYGRRAFSVAGPTTWNSLPKQLRDPVYTTSVFACLLKTFLFSEY